jgi:hypothetical protein
MNKENLRRKQKVTIRCMNYSHIYDTYCVTVSGIQDAEEELPDDDDDEDE